MKNIFVIVVLVSLFVACNDSKSDSSSTSFRITSANIEKFESPVPGAGTIFDIDSGAHTGNYAIIYSGTINNTDYVGIACSDDPKGPSPYNLKIYYEAASIASGTYSATIREETNTYSENLSLTINLNTTYSTDDYNVYDINGTSTNVGVIDITAVQADPN